MLRAAAPRPRHAARDRDRTLLRLAAFDAFVAAVQKQFDVPGIGVAIVRNGAVALERGYGVREVGKPEPVSAHTMFAIASNTEAFTAASLNMLQVDGRLAELLRAPHRVANWGLARAGVTPDAAAE